MFKAMTLNINVYGDKHGAWPARLPLIAAAIRDAQPDIVALQAVAQEPQRDHGQDQASQLAARLPGYHSVVFVAAMRDHEGRAKGSAFISRHRLVSQSHLSLSRQTGVEDGDQRIVLGVGLHGDEGPIQIFNAHFSWVYPQAQDNVSETLPYIGAWPGDALLMGDFNTTPEKALMSDFHRQGWIDSWQHLRPNDVGHTFESHAPDMRIDYIFANKSVCRRLRGIDVIGAPNARFSDHLGLMVTLV